MWYIIPAELVVGQGSIALYPTYKWAKYGPYKEAWNLLRGRDPEPCRMDRIEACADEGAEKFSLGRWFHRIWRGDV